MEKSRSNEAQIIAAPRERRLGADGRGLQAAEHAAGGVDAGGLGSYCLRRELDALIAPRGKPLTMVSANGTSHSSSRSGLPRRFCLGVADEGCHLNGRYRGVRDLRLRAVVTICAVQ